MICGELVEVDMRATTRSGAGVRGVFARVRGGLLSATIHAVVLLSIFGVLHSGLKLAPNRLPGTAQGVKYVTYYAPGSVPHPHADVPVKKAEKQSVAVHAPAPVPEPKTVAAPSAESGSGAAAESGLGEGDIKIALQKHFPYPTPDLSVMARKSSGDVILNAVIDERGNISNLTLLKGLGPAIDDVVIATVKQWSYAPATKNGVPVASEQELHFHFERG
jgi:protein TonB